MILQKLIDYAITTRLNMAPLTMSVPILGALTVGAGGGLLRLGLIGLCAHIFGFTLNALVDLRLDRIHLPRLPLAAGRVRPWEAGIVALGALGAAVLLFYPLGDTLAWGIFAASIAGSGVYNLWSKWGRLPRLLAEIALAISVGMLCLVGALSRSGDSPPLASIAYALALGLVLLLLNSVPSGLKDLKTDAAFGARSLVLALGASVADDDQMQVSWWLRAYAALVAAGMWLAVGWYAYLARPALWLVLLALAMLVWGALHLRLLLSLRSFDLLRRSKPLLSGYYHFAALLVLLLPRQPLLLQILTGVLVLRLVWEPLRSYRRVQTEP